MRGVGAGQHQTNEYAIVSMYFAGEDQQGKPVTAVIRREAHLVDSLKANMLINMDNLGSEAVVLNF